MEPRPPEQGDEPHKHLHARLTDARAAVYEFITEYLQVAGKAPDWYWRTVGRLEGQEVDNMEELLASAFEAGAYTAHDHPETLRFQWVTEKECEKERRAEEKAEGHEDPRQRDRMAMSHYA